MSQVEFIETPHNTVHAKLTGPADDYNTLVRRIASAAGRRKLGGRITSGASFNGDTVEVRVIYAARRA